MTSASSATSANHHRIVRVSTGRLRRHPMAGEPRRCQSRSKCGSCGLAAKHGGMHAVPIGDEIWFGYLRGGQMLGYGKFVDGEWTVLSPAVPSSKEPE